LAPVAKLIPPEALEISIRFFYRKKIGMEKGFPLKRKQVPRFLREE